MKILQLTHNYPSEIDRTEGIFLHRINRLLADKIDITVVVLRPKFGIPTGGRNYTLDGVNILEFNYFRPRGRILNSLDGLFMLSAIRYLNKRIENYDLIHSHWQSAAGVIGTYLSKKHNKPHIVSVRGARIFDKSRNSIYGLISSFVFGKANLIHTHGRSIQAELSRKYLIPAEKITWIPNIIFNKTQLDSLLQISLQKKIKTTGYIFLFIGLDGKNKGLLDAVQSFIGASTKNHQLIIVTDTSSDYYNRQVKPIISIRKNITIMNKMPPENVYILFSESDVFLFPSYSEGTPNVVAEAMAAGCYIISYKIPGLDDLLIHNRNGRLVEKKDKLSLTNEIDMFVSGKMNHDCEKYREYNHRFMVENYDSDKISGDYINMYKGCIRE